MSELLNVLTIPFLLAMFLAVTMGGSGTAPAFSAAYGANIIKRTMIPGLFGIMVLAGALLAGKQVSLTLGNGLLEQLSYCLLLYRCCFLICWVYHNLQVNLRYYLLQGQQQRLAV